MKRYHLFEFGDQSWLPTTIRRGFTEYLAAVSKWSQLYRSCATYLNELVAESPVKRIVVLGAGSGGGILDVVEDLRGNPDIVLTDILPDLNLILPSSRIQYYREPVDARNVPESLSGVRVTIAAFHHFRPKDAKEILRDAIESKQSIAVIEGTERTLLGLLSMIFIVPLVILVVMPFIRPFSLARLFWTYIIPAFPILGAWDGFVSCLRTYNEDDYRKLVSDIPAEWTYQKLKGPVSIFTGSPKD